MSMMNYPALFVTLATLSMLLLHKFVPSAMLASAVVILMSLVITVGICFRMENHVEKEP